MHGRIFKEEQTYRGTWVMYLILMLEIPTLILVSVLVLNSSEGQKEDFFGLVFVLLIMVLTMGLILNLKLSTRIDETGVHYRYFPFFKWRKISKEQIRAAEVISFSPLSDHGGWGIKGNSTTKAYTVIGEKGLELDINEKKKILIGTQKYRELSEFIENWMEE